MCVSSAGGGTIQHHGLFAGRAGYGAAGAGRGGAPVAQRKALRMGVCGNRLIARRRRLQRCDDGLDEGARGLLAVEGAQLGQVRVALPAERGEEPGLARAGQVQQPRRHILGCLPSGIVAHGAATLRTSGRPAPPWGRSLPGLKQH